MYPEVDSPRANQNVRQKILVYINRFTCSLFTMTCIDVPACQAAAAEQKAHVLENGGFRGVNGCRPCPRGCQNQMVL